MRRLKPKAEFAIESPCTQSWDAMVGSVTKRHCESCRKQVHNFAVMTPRQINRAVADSKGHLCARITRRTDGSLVTAQELSASGFAAQATGLLLAAALSTPASQAQSMTGNEKAVVSGRFTALNGGPPPAQGYVIFAANGQSILETKTDHDGSWRAEIAPGAYDIIFKIGPMFGERVNAVHIHAGIQEFAPVHGRFAYGHLNVIDAPGETFTTVGEMVATYRYPVSYLFKHPILYIKNLRHNFA